MYRVKGVVLSSQAQSKGATLPSKGVASTSSEHNDSIALHTEPDKPQAIAPGTREVVVQETELVPDDLTQTDDAAAT